MHAEIHEGSNKTNRYWIAHTKQQIGAIIRASVFVQIRPVFLGPVTYYAGIIGSGLDQLPDISMQKNYMGILK